MTPRSREQFDRMREESRERILRSGLTLFARHGFANTSVRMLAEDVGVAQGLLYNYFEGKHALLHAIFERSMEEVGGTFAAASDAASAEEALAVLVRSAFRAVRENEDFWRLSYQVRMQPDVLGDLGDRLRAWAEEIRARIEALLERAGDPRPAARSRLLFGAIDGVAQHYVLDPEGYPLDRVADELIRGLMPAADEVEASGGRPA